MGLSGQIVPFLDRDHILAYCHHLTGKLMAQNLWRFDPLLYPSPPVIDLEVCTADRGSLYLYQDLCGTDSRGIYIYYLCARALLCLDDSLHCLFMSGLELYISKPVLMLFILTTDYGEKGLLEFLSDYPGPSCPYNTVVYLPYRCDLGSCACKKDLVRYI